MQLKLLTASIGLLNISVSACNLNLPQEKLLGQAKTPYLNPALDKSLGNSIAYHHIIPRQDFEEILYITFNNLNIANNEGVKQFFKQVVAQIINPQPGVEFKDNQTKNKVIQLLNSLSTGNINNKLIDGKNEGCLLPEQQKLLQNYTSYLPANGFFGPDPLMNDPGSADLDSYGKYFMAKSTFLAVQALFANKNLKDKAINLELLNTMVNGYQITAFNSNLWGKVGNNKFACLVNQNYSACLDR